jgi:hypothetical protein
VLEDKGLLGFASEDIMCLSTFTVGKDFGHVGHDKRLMGLQIFVLTFIFGFEDSVNAQNLCFPQNPCKNGGICSAWQNGYSCYCVGQWTGMNCDTRNSFSSTKKLKALLLKRGCRIFKASWVENPINMPIGENVQTFGSGRDGNNILNLPQGNYFEQYGIQVSVKPF